MVYIKNLAHVVAKESEAGTEKTPLIIAHTAHALIHALLQYANGFGVETVDAA